MPETDARAASRQPWPMIWMMLVCVGVMFGLQLNGKDGAWLLSVKKFAGHPVAQEPLGWKLRSMRKQIANRRTPPTGGWAPTMML